MPALPDATVVANSLATGLLLGGMLALTALGLSVALGVLRLVNLAHGELLVGGAHLGYFALTQAGIDPLLRLPLAGAAMALLAVPAGAGAQAAGNRAGGPPMSSLASPSVNAPPRPVAEAGAWMAALLALSALGAFGGPMRSRSVFACCCSSAWPRRGT